MKDTTDIEISSVLKPSTPMVASTAAFQTLLHDHEDWVYMQGAEGKRADLRGFDLRGVDLRGTILDGCDCRRAILVGADLRGTHFKGSDLRDADLRGADLRGAYLFFADLCEVDLRGADLRSVNADGAVLREVDFRGAELAGANFRGADLTASDFRDVDLHGVDFSGADLREAVLGQTAIVQLGPIGAQKDYLVLKRFEDGSTEVMMGACYYGPSDVLDECFRGTLDAFETAVSATPLMLREYQAAIQFFRAFLAA